MSRAKGTKAFGLGSLRKDAEEKITGRAIYTDDLPDGDVLHGFIVTSSQAHARIVSVNKSRALATPGVHAVLTGYDCPTLTGDPIADRPILAVNKVRYAGEPVAIVIADELHQAMAAALLVEIEYDLLPVVQSPKVAFAPSTPLVHPHLNRYHWTGEANPKPGTNIATHIRIKKGHADEIWPRCDVTVECHISFPQAHHAAMETRCVIAEILPGGDTVITSATQSPYSIPALIADTFDVPESSVRVHVPFVGGGFGGKSSLYIEPLAVAAAKAVGGRKVKIRCTREQDMMTLPGHIGLESTIRLGATRDGRILVADITYWFDCGGYADRGVIVTRAAAQDCTGPYRIDHVICNAYSMYTNHPPTTSYRGFGHPEQTLVMERAVDELAKKLALDALELRRINAIQPGDTTPTQARLTRSSVGNLPVCLSRLKQLLDWQGPVVEQTASAIRTKGIAAVWKTSSTPPNASSGAVVLVHRDGRVTLVSGVVEIGQGTKTALAQMVAEVFQMRSEAVDVVFEVDTRAHPEHWKTVASRGTLLAGNAAVRAAKDAVRQLARTAAVVIRCNPEDVQIEDGFASCRHRSERIPIGELSHGYVFSDGTSVGRMVVGCGSYTIEGVTSLDFETGEGVPGPEWTIAAQGVEVEYFPKDYTYRVTRAVTVVDAGAVANPQLALGQVKGAMSMGLSLASREGFVYDAMGRVSNPQLRVYPIHRYGDQPMYEVDFVLTPHLSAPFGVRGLGEHGLIGMPAALANALTLATGVQVNQMPMTPELLWRLQGGGRH
ncbi:xanthine dehydrogenase family protein molybdopterin-binding subunit [Alicyclobacillus curvatus]|nr:xanthine dehydrogenase family protein molybdopterin-binding subunit [Alicyclobacillus curvatus]